MGSFNVIVWPYACFVFTFEFICHDITSYIFSVLFNIFRYFSRYC